MVGIADTTKIEHNDLFLNLYNKYINVNSNDVKGAHCLVECCV